MSSHSRIAVAGITGKLGTLVAQSLLSHTPEVDVVGYCRSASKVDASIAKHPRLHVFEGSSSDLAKIRNAIKGCDAVVCCYLGPDDFMFDGQKLLIDACIAEKVPRYIASDYVLLSFTTSLASAS